jgi:hypothetical protein
MAQSLSERLQQDRLVVVAVEKDAGRVRLKHEGDLCSDLVCDERTLVVSDEETSHDLAALNPGDIVKVDTRQGRPDRIVVLRRVWEEFTSPEV